MASEFEKLLRKADHKRKWPSAFRKQPLALLALLALAAVVMGLLTSEYLLSSREEPSESQVNAPRVINGGNAWDGSSDTNNGTIASRALGEISGRVTRVRDGDTIEVGRIAIRLAKLNCLEKGTVTGDAATRKMKQLVSGQNLTCSLTGERSYDRKVGSCRLPNGRDIGRAMIASGACKPWR